MTTEAITIKLKDLDVEVIQKNIKNVHLSVYPPNGRVKVSAPRTMAIDTIRVFLISKLAWIKKQQEKLRKQERETERDYIDRESHYFNGNRYLLKIVETSGPARVELKARIIELYIRPGASIEKRQAVLNAWYRQHLKNAIPKIIQKYEKSIKVQVREFGIKKMKTKWGACNPAAQRIWLNLELAKKPPECLEYIVVHEMVHLLERRHNSRFVSFMNVFMPNWSYCKDELNRLPIRHEHWGY